MVFSDKIQEWKTTFVSLVKTPKMFFMLLLGFCSGMPLFLVYATLSAWLRDEGVSRTASGYFVWVGFAYSLKFLWSPFLDKLPAFGIEKFLGRRKGWIFISQFGVFIGVLAMAFSEPTRHLSFTAYAAVFTAFWGATQDVAIDAWRIESAEEKKEQGMLVTLYQMGYRIAYYSAVVFGFILADIFSWQQAYIILAFIFLSVSLVSLFSPRVQFHAGEENTSAVSPAKTSKRDKDYNTQSRFILFVRSVLERITEFMMSILSYILGIFKGFIKRYGLMAILILLLISTYRLTDFVMGVMANPFYIDLGFSKIEIAASIKTFGPVFTLIGALCAGIGLYRLGLKPLLVIGACLGAFSNLGYAVLAFHAEQMGGSNLSYLMIALAIENFSGGLAGTVLIAFMSSLTDLKFVASQYALFSSLYAFSSKLFAGFSGKMVDSFARPVLQAHTDISSVTSNATSVIQSVIQNPVFRVEYTSEFIPKLSGYAPFFLLSAVIGLLAIFLSIVWLKYGLSFSTQPKRV